jgi:hypothetical protein
MTTFEPEWLTDVSDRAQSQLERMEPSAQPSWFRWMDRISNDEGSDSPKG